MNFVSHGYLNLFQMAFIPIPDKPGIVKYGFRICQATFMPSEPYVVMTFSKSNFWRTKAWTEIRKFPAVMTDSHIATIKDITLGLIASCNLAMDPLLMPPEPRGRII